MSLLYPLALPSPFSSGGVIDRLQRFRPPTALSSFRDTLSVLIRAVIGRLAVAERDQGHADREMTMTFLRRHLQFVCLTFPIPTVSFFFFFSSLVRKICMKWKINVFLLLFVRVSFTLIERQNSCREMRNENEKCGPSDSSVCGSHDDGPVCAVLSPGLLNLGHQDSCL